MLLSTLMGNGATAELDAALHAKLDDAAVPVFVVLTRTPSGFGGSSVDAELATLVHAGLERDGVYIVRTTQGFGHVAVYGDLDPAVENDDTLLSLARYQAIDQVRPAIEAAGPELEMPAVTEAALVLDLVAGRTIPDYETAVLSDDQVAGYTERPWVSAGYVFEEDEPAAWEPGLGALVGVTVALVTATAAYRLLRARAAVVARRRAAAAAERTQVAAAAEAARSAVAALERALEGRGPRRPEPGRRETASRCADAARDLLGSEDLLDLVGAEVLARTGSQALRTDGSTYRCCFLDPRHGRARAEVGLPGGLSVPVCRGCRHDLDADRTPAPLLEDGRPYYDGDSVWARAGYGALTDSLCDVVRQEDAR